MADDYIRKADAKDALQEKVFHNLTDEFYGAMQVIDELPSADVVPVVRCKDCLFFTTEKSCCRPEGLIKAREDAFCSYGERREE